MHTVANVSSHVHEPCSPIFFLHWLQRRRYVVKEPSSFTQNLGTMNIERPLYRHHRLQDGPRRGARYFLFQMPLVMKRLTPSSSHTSPSMPCLCPSRSDIATGVGSVSTMQPPQRRSSIFFTYLVCESVPSRSIMRVMYTPNIEGGGSACTEACFKCAPYQ